MASRAFTLGCIVTPSGQINQIQDCTLDTGIEEYLAFGDGKVDPDYAAVLMQQPRISFRTTAIARALGYIGISGLALASACDFYNRQYAQGGTRTAAGALKITGTYGLIYPTSIEADQREASISYEAVLRSNDGTTAPIAVATGQTMPALTAADQLFVAGPVSLNGTLMDCVESTRIDFGIELLVVGGDGRPYPSYIAIRRRQPSITIRTYDLQQLNALGVGGAAQGATDSLVYLRKCAADGTRVADATAEHIKFSIDQGRIYVPNAGGGDGEAMAEVRITPTWDGTADVIAISAASAIA